MAKNTIYYGFSDVPLTGGDYVAVDHIAALNRLGFNAKAFYGAPDEGYRKYTVPVVRLGTLLQPDDIMVLGEVHNFELLRTVPCLKIMHNQNPYMTFSGHASVAALNAYPLTHILVPSDFCGAKLREMGVAKSIHRVRPALPHYFTPGTKKLQIAYAPGKRPLEAEFLKEYFRGLMPDYVRLPWVKLQGLTREAIAGALAVSAVYAALPLLEGLGLMSLEAMASGCHVVGYTGHGGAEYAKADNGDWIDDGDHAGFAAKLREACRFFESGTSNPKIAAARATAAGFNQANFEAELTSVWKTVLGDKAGLYRL